MNFNSIVFYNFFNNGDIHLSRGFVKYIINKLSLILPDLKFFYAHKKDHNLLSDIINLKIDSNLLNDISDYKAGSFIKNNILYINTWYGSENYKFMNSHALSFDTLYLLFNDTCERYFNFSLPDSNLENLFPDIDFSFYNINSIKEFINKYHEPRVLVANGLAQSGQSINFDLTSAINKLAYKYHGVTFILTNKDNTNITLRENIIYSKDIIKNNDCSDLNENAYLGLNCKLTIGRASGVHSFCLNKENLFNKNNILISFSDLNYNGQFWLHDKFKDKIKYSSNVINYNINNSEKAQEIIDNNIKMIWVK